MFQPATALLEFLTWLAWLACFSSIQSKLCEHYPGARALCRQAYGVTMALPIVAATVLLARAESGTDVFAAMNHVFGAAVFMQTFLRALTSMKWLVMTSLPHYLTAGGNNSYPAAAAEGGLLAAFTVLAQAMRRPWRQGEPSLAAGAAAGKALTD